MAKKRILSEEKEREIWEKSRAFCFYAMLPKPKIVEDPSTADATPEAKQELQSEDAGPEFITFFDNQTYLNMPVILKDLKIKNRSELENAVEFLMKHGVMHYSLIPYDFLNQLILDYKATKGVESAGITDDGEAAQKIGANINNVFMDIVDNNYIIEHGDEKGHPQNREQALFFYDRVNKHRNADPKRKKLPRKTWDVYMRIYEKLWNEDGRWVDKKNFSEEQEKAAERLYILAKEDMYNSNNWEKKIYRFAQVLAPFIKEDSQQGNDLLMFENNPSGKGKKLKQMLKELDKMKGKKGLEKKTKDLEKEIENQLKGLAQKLSKNSRNLVKDYNDLLAGIGAGDEKKAQKWLYRSLASKYDVKFRPLQKTEGKANPYTPVQWVPSDPPQSLDIIYTLLTHGIIIPSETTKKWKYKKRTGFLEGGQPPDLYEIIDSSGSMMDPTQYISPAVLGAMVAAHSARNTGSKVAVKNFSAKDGGSDITTLDETEDEEAIDDTILIYKNGGTILPTEDLLEWIKNPEIPKQFLLITDTHFHNFENAFPYLKSIMELNKKNRGAIFCIGRNNVDEHVKKLEKVGYEIFYLNAGDDLLGLVVGKARDVYEGIDEIT